MNKILTLSKKVMIFTKIKKVGQFYNEKNDFRDVIFDMNKKKEQDSLGKQIKL